MNIIERDKKYHLRFRYKDAHGMIHQKHFCKSEWKKKKDAKDFYDEYMKKVERSASAKTVNDLYHRYIEERQMKLKSRYNIESVWRIYIEPTIGQIMLNQITQADIRRWQKELLKGNHSNRYLGKIQDTLRTIFIFGYKHEYIDRNPFMIENVSFEEEKKVVMHWTPGEFQRFIDQADNDLYADFFKLLYWTGLRYGEAVALTVKDFDEQSGTINVNKTWDNVHKVATSPKTHNSYRTVVCTNEVKTLLCERLRVCASVYGNDEDSILFGVVEHLSPRTMQHAFERYSLRAGLPKINIHALRHSHVFVLRRIGFDAFEIAKRLGHTVEMVNQYYGQWFLETQKEMVEKIENYVENGTKLGQTKSEYEKKPIK